MRHNTISHRTALRTIRERRIDPTNINYLKRLIECLGNVNALPKEKIDLLVNSKNQSRQSKKIRYHVATYNIRNSMLEIFSDNLSCTKPELTILQLANELSFESLFLLVCEFCGTYGIDELNHSFVPGLKPATSIENIKKFGSGLLKEMKFFRGQSRLIKVLHYAQNNSYSPMESRLLLKFSGPRNMGMYGIKGLELNKPVKLSRKAALIAGQSTVVPDLANTKYKVAIEYDSAQFHEEVKRGQKDKRRRDALVQDGWITHTIVPSIMNNPNSFHVVAKDVLNETGQNSRIRNQNFISNRNALFERLA